MRQVTGDLTTFAVYVAKMIFIVAGIPLLILFALGTLNSITIGDILSAKGAYWLICGVIALFCVVSKKFYFAFLICLPFLLLFLYFGGIDYLANWLY
ncbi:hypothetical protein FHQ26_11725 [Testudinibacter sp. TR-2022]|uniref:hypothetical protein n=1 Tax=Testudinibacter sp. TR-2022 TaxID=2585029 RepID=UPI001119F43D|nr:hypothetical protein [Testudinibacter sp. TR-2022]TNH02203.1 hypothetical protein FHQ22_10480 [Pasteurellaceae bacterium Phil31]TNH05599.1 hypothetical protein FHQ26_11725 [Testudinibacter sp. TR-2022]TNH08821.1 hypothetical protein FHQ25_08925 [Testudinibacter sp. TR-2022]TNH14477.1 hypothetical protein FHQ23_11050 [Testudinibacter sp. TR-2022]TNH15474.1 hypothetical protein FIA56_03340 [Testudinibacter sp. TR-2022]